MNNLEFVTKDKGPPGFWERFLSHIMLFGEDIFKVLFFRCQRCGECILSHTAFVCSQRCPKRIRNGPCAGTRDGGYCEVYPDKRCVWYLIYTRAARQQRLGLLQKLGYSPYFVKEAENSFLLVVGAFMTRKGADKQGIELQLEGIQNQIIKR